MRGRRRFGGGCSCLAPAEDAVDCFDWVALLAGLVGHEPSFVGVGSAELAWAGVVGVYPSAVADDVAAVAVGFAAVCVEFYWRVHLVSPRVWGRSPRLFPTGRAERPSVVE